MLHRQACPTQLATAPNSQPNICTAIDKQVTWMVLTAEVKALELASQWFPYARAPADIAPLTGFLSPWRATSASVHAAFSVGGVSFSPFSRRGNLEVMLHWPEAARRCRTGPPHRAMIDEIGSTQIRGSGRRLFSRVMWSSNVV
jgi:hypothetical protein